MYMYIGAVDYAFFLPSGLTLDYYESLARTKLSNPQLNILPPKCKASIKKAICSNIYLKCPSSINLSSNKTWNYNIFSDIGQKYPVPYQRPCLSVCTNTNSNCLGLLNIFNLGLNCLSRHDYSNGLYTKNVSTTFPYTYDQSNNNSICNNMPAVVSVADTFEPYVYAEKGACSGIITSLYVPTGM
jgi:hypothetical protein